MPTTSAVVGNGPLEFTSSNGAQVSIPLSALQFTNGTLSIKPTWTPNPPYSSPDLAIIKALLQYLASQQLIVPAVAPSPKPAAIVNAADPGTAGNNIQVTVAIISSNPDPTLTTFSIAVTETDKYTTLTAATIEGILGSDTVTGTQPGLVHVINASIDPQGIPTPGNYPLSVIPPATKASVSVYESSSPLSLVFALEAKKAGLDGSKTTVTIASVGGSAFDLTAVWTNTVFGVAIGTLQQSMADNFSYEITVQPPSGGVFSVPAPATANLSGGTSGTTASATLFSSQ
jgi:hypothetical protein